MQHIERVPTADTPTHTLCTCDTFHTAHTRSIRTPTCTPTADHREWNTLHWLETWLVYWR